MKDARQTNYLWAIFAGFALLAVQGGNWNGTVSLSQTGAPAAKPAATTPAQETSKTPAQGAATTPAAPAGAAKPPAANAPAAPAAAANTPAAPSQLTSEAGTFVCDEKCIQELRAKNESQERELKTFRETTAKAKEDNDKKDKCDKESLLEEFECLANEVNKESATKEDREAFAAFITGDKDIESCTADDYESSPNSDFRKALKQNVKRAMAALRKGMKKIKDNKSDLSCIAMNTAKDFENERVEGVLRARLTNIDKQIRQARINGNELRVLELEQTRMRIGSLYATSRDTSGIYHKGVIPEFDSIYRTTVRDLFRDDPTYYSMDTDGRGPMGDVYEWLDAISLGRDPSFYNGLTTTRNGVAVRDFSDFYRSRNAGLRGTSLDFNLGTTPPLYRGRVGFQGSSTRLIGAPSLLDRTISGDPFTSNSVIRGRAGGRPLIDL